MSRLNSKAKVLKESTTTLVDANGNVIEETNIKEMSVPREPNFVKLYIDGLSRIFDLSGGENKFLIELLKYVTYDNEITLNSGVKKRISEKTGYKAQTIDNYISTLKRHKIIRATNYRGIFMINPEIFGKGDWKEIYKYRAKFQKLCVSFEITNDMKDIKDAKFNVKCFDDEEKIELVAQSKNLTTEEFFKELEEDEIDLSLNAENQAFLDDEEDIE